MIARILIVAAREFRQIAATRSFWLPDPRMTPSIGEMSA